MRPARAEPTTNRPLLDQTMMRVAQAVAQRSTCPAANVGAVIVRDARIVATGYNGAPTGALHCSEAGCAIPNDLGGREYSRHIHAEVNALLQCAMDGKSCKNSTVYVTQLPCFDCLKFLAQAGVKKIVIPNGPDLPRWWRATYDFRSDLDLRLCFVTLDS